jgi:hypothetical protein
MLLKLEEVCQQDIVVPSARMKHMSQAYLFLEKKCLQAYGLQEICTLKEGAYGVPDL